MQEAEIKSQEKVSEIKKSICNIDEVYMLICFGDINKAFKQLGLIIPDINEILTEFIRNIPKLKQYEIEVPSDVILQQLNNMLDALEHRDSMMLADTLHYELTDTLQFYMEIIQELTKENIMIS